MATLQLTKGFVAVVDDRLVAHLSQWRWSASVKGPGLVYAVRGTRVNGKSVTIPLHRYLLNAQPGFEVDHIDGDTLNNRLENLRLVTHRQNTLNTGARRGGTSQFKGVHWHRASGKWKAEITVDGKNKHLGLFVDEEEAARTYDKAALHWHGPTARLNLPVTED